MLWVYNVFPSLDPKDYARKNVTGEHQYGNYIILMSG